MALLVAGCGGSAEPGPRPGPPANVSLVGEPLYGVVGTALDVTVKVTDANGLAVPNQLVNWVIVQGNGTLFVSSVTTSATGEAKNQWTLGTQAGEQAIEARAVGQLTGAPIVVRRITARARPGPATQIELGVVLSGQHVADGGASVLLGATLNVASLVLRVTDAHGNVIESPTYAVTSAPAGWAIQGARVTAPASESEGPITFGTGNASATVRVFAVRDLRSVRLRASWACTYASDHPKVVSGQRVDSTTAAMNVDSARYATDPGTRRGHPHYSADAILYASGTTTHHLADRSTASAPEQRDFMVLRQWVDSLAMQLAVSSATREWDGTAPPQSGVGNVIHSQWRVRRDRATPMRYRASGRGCTDYWSRETWWLLEEY